MRIARGRRGWTRALALVPALTLLGAAAPAATADDGGSGKHKDKREIEICKVVKGGYDDTTFTFSVQVGYEKKFNVDVRAGYCKEVPLYGKGKYVTVTEEEEDGYELKDISTDPYGLLKEENLKERYGKVLVPERRKGKDIKIIFVNKKVMKKYQLEVCKKVEYADKKDDTKFDFTLDGRTEFTLENGECARFWLRAGKHQVHEDVPAYYELKDVKAYGSWISSIYHGTVTVDLQKDTTVVFINKQLVKKYELVVCKKVDYGDKDYGDKDDTKFDFTLDDETDFTLRDEECKEFWLRAGKHEVHEDVPAYYELKDVESYGSWVSDVYDDSVTIDLQKDTKVIFIDVKKHHDY